MKRACQRARGLTILVCLAVLSGSGCGKSVSPSEAERGFLSRSFDDGEGLEHKYLVFAPHTRPPQGEKLPVILFLNGFNENGGDGVRQIRNNFGLQVWEMEAWFPFLAVIPQCSEGADWSLGGKDAEWTLKILDEAIREFGGDPDRVTLTGVSAGGSGVWQIGSAYPERFAALVPLCGTAMPNVEKLSKAEMPIWNFYNDKDRPELVDANRRIRSNLIAAGLSPLVSEFNANGHDCWNQAWRMHALYDWMLQQKREKHLTASHLKFLAPAEVIDQWKKPDSGTWSTASESEILGQATENESVFTSDMLGPDFDLHLDFWLGQEPFNVAFTPDHPEDSTFSAFRLHVPAAPAGSGGVLLLRKQEWLCELAPAAQHWLRQDGWNEARISMRSGRLSVLLNGWSAVDVAIPPVGATSRHRVGLVAPAGGEARFRYLRLGQLAVHE